MKQISFARRLSDAVFTFLFALIIFTMIIITVIQNTLFSSDFYIRQVDASGFSEIVLTEIQESFRSYVNALDMDIEIPDDFVTDHITLGQVDEAIKQTITASFNNTAPYDYSSFTDQLFDDLKEYVETELSLLYANLPDEVRALIPDIDFTEMTADFAAKCEGIFASYIDMPIFSQVAYLSRTYGPVLDIGQMVLAASALIFLVLLLKFSLSLAHGFRRLICAFSAVVLLNILCFSARLFPAQFFLNFLGISLERESVRLLASQCVAGAISAFTWPLIICVFILIVCIVAYLITRTTAQRERC